VTVPRDADVAIVGFGPVGAMAAHLCAVHGLSAVAFDREPDVYTLPRAVAVDDEVQRILQAAGVLDAVLPHAAPQVGAEFVNADGTRIMGVEIPLGLRTANGHPPLLGVHQPDLERVLRARLAERPGVHVHLGLEMIALARESDGVRLGVRDLASGTEHTVRARWLLGCDGARSSVREACGIAWDSLGYDHLWLVVDVLLERLDVPLPTFVQQICDPDRPTTFVTLPGRRRRWEFQLKAGETREAMEDPERVWELLGPWLGPADATLERAALYRFHSTIADRFRAGPVFLAGDAAHQTPPFLGQGMCTGIRDVANRVWKIAAVHGGRAGDALLDSYTAERRPMAVAMVEHSVSVGRLIDAYAAMARGGPAPPAELREYGYGGSRSLPHLQVGLFAEGDDGVRGRTLPHDLVPTPAGPKPLDDVIGPTWAVLGVREPCMHDATRRFWKYLGGIVRTVPEPRGALLAVLGAHDAVVVRPDRLVFAVTTPDTDLDAITSALATRLGVPSAGSPDPPRVASGSRHR
jgi:3-(3-hydroxy-phenyl)propionate hydroxylase